MSQRKSKNYRAWQIANKGRARRARLLEQHRVRMALRRRREQTEAEERSLMQQITQTAGEVGAQLLKRVGGALR